MEQGSLTTRAGSAELGNLAEASPSTLGEKVEMLEQGFRDAAPEASTAVTDKVATEDMISEGCPNIEDAGTAVTDTVATGKAAVAEAAEGLKWAFDLRRQVRLHPWLMLGGAALVGYMVGSFLYPHRQ